MVVNLQPFVSERDNHPLAACTGIHAGMCIGQNNSQVLKKNWTPGKKLKDLKQFR